MHLDTKYDYPITFNNVTCLYMHEILHEIQIHLHGHRITHTSM